VFVFKRGAATLSLSLTPANPWFPPVPVLDAAPVALDWVSVFQPAWLDADGRAASRACAQSLELRCDAPLLARLDGEGLVHLGAAAPARRCACRRARCATAAG